MVDIQPAAAEIRREKKKDRKIEDNNNNNPIYNAPDASVTDLEAKDRKKLQGKNIMACPIT